MSKDFNSQKKSTCCHIYINGP